MMQRLAVTPEISALADLECDVTLSTDQLARDGSALVPKGCRMANFQRNPVVLFNHDPALPIGRCDNLRVTGSAIVGRVRFAPPGISAVADSTRGLVKAGILNAVSIGFAALKVEPIDPRRREAGVRIPDWELLELSFVAMPADTGAMVTGRSLDAAEAERRRRALAMLALGAPAELDADELARRRRELATLAIG